MTQGERVKKVRKKIGLTLEKFGEKVGVGKTAISKIEHDQCNLSEQMAISICREFSVDYTWLTTGEGDDIFEKSPSSTMEQLKKEFNLDDFSYNLVYQYLKLNADQRQAVRDFFYNAADGYCCRSGAEHCGSVSEHCCRAGSTVRTKRGG